MDQIVDLTRAGNEVTDKVLDAKTLFDRAVALEGLDQDGNTKPDFIPDHKTAFGLYRQAAELRYPAAIYNLAMCHFHGHGIQMDKTKAVELLRQAVDAELPRAMTNLGYCYELGLGGLEKNESIAMELYRRAAEKNDETGRRNAADLTAHRASNRRTPAPA